VSIFDIIILILLVLYTGIGALRGMLREFLSLAVWIVAIGSGWLFADTVASWFEVLQDADLRRLLAFLAIVLTMLGALSILAFVLRTLLPRPDPGLANRGVGAVLGAVRGAAVVVVMVLLAGLTSLPKKADWRDAYLVGVFQPVASKILEWLPSSVARQFRYS
jgi:membrane protein required for colicin V production